MPRQAFFSPWRFLGGRGSLGKCEPSKLVNLQTDRSTNCRIFEITVHHNIKSMKSRIWFNLNWHNSESSFQQRSRRKRPWRTAGIDKNNQIRKSYWQSVFVISKWLVWSFYFSQWLESLRKTRFPTIVCCWQLTIHSNWFLRRGSKTKLLALFISLMTAELMTSLKSQAKHGEPETPHTIPWRETASCE
jgi:hypothetical protein